MDNFTITLNGQDFSFEKNEYNFYVITPYKEDLEVNDLSTALLQQKDYYIEEIRTYNPIPVSEENKLEDEGTVIPFNVKKKCYFAVIKKSKIK